MKNPSVLTVLLLGISLPAFSAPLSEARINRVQHDVKITEASGSAKAASEGEMVHGTQGIRTGAQSAAELLFPDNTLARLGSDTMFTFETGTRKMNLENGTLLFQIPKGVGGASIRTGAITAAITGTTGFIERGPTHYKLVLLEGTMRVFLNDRMRESMLVSGGQMLIGPIKSGSIKDWQTVPIDTAKLMNTSKLLDKKKFAPLSGAASTKIEEVIEHQRTQLQKGGLAETNLVIDGFGTTLLAVQNAAEAKEKKGKLEQFQHESHSNPTPTPRPAALPNPGPSPTPRPAAVDGDELADYPGVNDGAFATSTYRGATTHNKPFTLQISKVDSRTIFDLRGSTPMISGSSSGKKDDNNDNENDGEHNHSSTSGTIYGGWAADGPASSFLFKSTSNFDVQTSFDGKFGSNYDFDFPRSGVAVFSFKKLEINGTPHVYGLSTARNIALVSADGIKLGKDSLSLNDFASLTLAATKGDIRLDKDGDVSSTASAFHFLHLYNRSGKVKLEGTISLPQANLFIDAARDIDITGDSHLVFNRGAFNAWGDITLDAPVEADYFQLDAGGDLSLNGVLQTHELFALADGQLNVQQPISATPKASQTTGGVVSLEAADTVTVSSTVNATSAPDPTVTGAGSRIKLVGKRLTGTAISISSTGQLNALLDTLATGPGGKVTLESRGGAIVVNGTITAPKGTVDIQNSGTNGVITFNGATIAADVVKVGAMGNNGTLNIGGGSIAADTLLKLYAGGSNGTVHFQDNVTLNGNSTKIIAANTVQIDNSKVVTVNGLTPAQVYTNNAHYTGSGGDSTTTGTFGGQGATTQAHSARPSF
ncbi:MAG: FecR family protein [Chthoniobacterales bacterium]